MTILTMNRKVLESKIGKVTEEIENSITMMGTPIEEVTGEYVSVEVFPNRPDLLSLENFARTFNQFKGKEKVASFDIKSSGEKLLVKKSVPKEWPYAIACIVKGINFDDAKIKSIIDIQEKLGGSILRKRKRGGIGLYPLEKIKFPITFEGRKPEEIIFRPLDSEKELSGNKILKEHPKGIEYASVCEAWEKFPVFVDSSGKIMSMPPITNSEDLGKVSEGTKDIFLEATGDNLHIITKAFNIMVSSLIEMGGKVYSIDCEQFNGKKLVVPDMSNRKLKFKISDIEKTLGINLSEKEVKKYLSQMGLGYESEVALIPAYRADILHWIDLTEEIAIAYGYENFEAEIPKISTIASEDSLENRKRVISNILANFGLLETSSFHLTTKNNIKKMHFEFKDFLEVENSKTERDVLRIDLMTNLLQILSENNDSSYPQKIFEMGRVFEKDKKTNSETGVNERERLAVALIDENVDFTEIKKVLDYLFRMLGIEEYSLKVIEDSNYISGRVGAIFIGKKEIGRIGEISPRVLKNWKIKLPVSALELDLDEIIS